MLPAAHRLADAESLTLADLADDPWVQSLLALVAAGVGVARLSLSARTLRDSGVVFVPLRGDTASVFIAWSDAWRLISSNGRVSATSGESFASFDAAKKSAVELHTESAEAAVVREPVEA